MSCSFNIVSCHMLKLSCMLWFFVWVALASEECMPQKFKIFERPWKPVNVWNAYITAVGLPTFNLTFDQVPCQSGCCEATFRMRR